MSLSTSTELTTNALAAALRAEVLAGRCTIVNCWNESPMKLEQAAKLIIDALHKLKEA